MFFNIPGPQLWNGWLWEETCVELECYIQENNYDGEPTDGFCFCVERGGKWGQISYQMGALSSGQGAQEVQALQSCSWGKNNMENPIGVSVCFIIDMAALVAKEKMNP